MARPKSIEPLVTDWANQQLISMFDRTYPEQIRINNEVEEAFSKSGSKHGTGFARPDNKVMRRINGKNILILLEYKGHIDRHVMLDKDDKVDVVKKTAIKDYAVNGAVFYSQAIIDHTRNYDEIIAIGISDGIIHKGSLSPHISAYYISRDNYAEPQLVNDKYEDLSFLSEENFEAFLKKARELTLSDSEREAIHERYEANLSDVLKNLNEKLHELNIDVNVRVNMLSGMIMASMPNDGTNDFEPLAYEELRGLNPSSDRSDGAKILEAISDFLRTKQIPPRKQEQIMRRLTDVFSTESFSDPNSDNQEGESKLKTIYRMVITELLPFYAKGFRMDFTGKLFDILNSWVQVPDSGKNDIVLTPRYVTRLMARLTDVNMDSFVWDFAAGSAGFLVSAMDIMIEDAKKNFDERPVELREKIENIKDNQLLGIEKNNDMYMLAVLNMILMGDGSSNIIQADSLTYPGVYQYPPEKKDILFPANTFLLNPPYSSDGKGLIFLEKALSKMDSGMAAILIQESAGSELYKSWHKRILQKHTLKASIHMPSDLFIGKAGVQTAIFLFEVNKPHEEERLVRFVDFSKDGYKRTNRKKAKQNLFNVNDAHGHYDELVKLIKYDNVSSLQYFSDENYIKDTISLNGGDWQYLSHARIDKTPTEKDFQNVVSDYIQFQLSHKLKGEDND
ncbi:N-6 DNA methylase [Pseudoalteromonas gelatinilytica]|uniref:site-specific DNA-methyltransferase (adenine-specific) n=1 Tax=Pseudoalteromonas gelatinilytica TaxID=1703256 RepID=A0A3A3EDS5_9GAMM|nr:N-6 DNA methylase [Pseudoalteromonas profundi]RJF32060.1 N-6 DNA methylase [Pseudoalteromonas profundi]